MLNLNIYAYDMYSICILCACFLIVTHTFIANFLTPRKNKRWLYFFMLPILYVSVVFSVIYLDSLMRFLMLLVILTTYAYICFQDHIFKIWFVILLAFLLEISCKTIIRILFLHYFDPTYEPLLHLLSFVLFIFITFLCKNRIRFLNYDHLSLKYALMFSIVPFISILIINNVFLLNIEYDRMNYIYSLVTIVLFLILNYVVLTIFDVFIKEAKNQQTLSVYEDQLKLYNEYTVDKEQSMKDLRTLKHDLMNRFLSLKGILSNGDLKQADEYITNLITFTSHTDAKIKCGNIAIDTILNYKENIGVQKGIKFSYEIEVPVELPFPLGDICILLGNALDNAIEANKKEEISERYIKVFIKYVQHNLLIQIINPYRGDLKYSSFGDLLTTKTSLAHHGLGMDSMKQVMQKYHGNMNILTDHHVFDLQILLFHKE